MSGILIVEDEFLVALDLEDIIAGAGYPVVGIIADRKGIDALAAPPLLALVDVNLRDGPTGVDIARSLAIQHGTRIIFVTANPAQIVDPPANAIGVIQKPFNPETIESSLGYALNENDEDPPRGLQRFG
jgi:DNA-binding response OmpR family regulator